jgi:L-asparaginase
VKTESFRPSAFASPARGPVGFVTPDRLRLDGPAPARFLLDPPEQLNAPVAVLTTYTGMPGELLHAAVATTGARGLILDGTGAGNVPGAIVPAIDDLLADGIVVAVATRVATGGTVAIYGGPGGGVSLRDAGVLPCGRLTAAKARLLLMAALAGSEDPAHARSAFAEGIEALGLGALGA